MKLLVLACLVGVAFSAYDDLPKVADPYEAPGYEPTPPKDCPDVYSKIIKELRTELGDNVSRISFTNKLGSRCQQRLGSAHEVMMGTRDVKLKTNFNGTVCNTVSTDGFTYVVYPNPGNYDINNAAVEEYFEKFAEFAASGSKTITGLPKDPRSA